MWTSEQRRRSLAERLHHLEEAIAAAETNADRLTHGQGLLLADLKLTLTSIIEQTERAWTLSQGKDAKEAEVFKLARAAFFEALLREITQKVVPVLTGASSSLVPVELEPVVQAMMKAAVGEWEWSPILFSSPQYNYSVQLLPNAKDIRTGKIGEATVLETGPRLLSLSTPSAERDSIGLHTVLLGHEIGHLYDWNRKVSGDYVPDLPGSLVDQPDAIVMYTTIAGSWCEEIVADIYSCLLLGPAAVFALPELSVTSGAQHADLATHPATDRRTRIMAEVLGDLGFAEIEAVGPIIKEFLGQNHASLSREVHLEHETLDLPAQEAWNFISKNLAAIKKSCKESFGSQHFKTDDWPDVLKAADMLAAGLPCGEAAWTTGSGRQPTAVPVILNAAWLVKTTRMDELAKVLRIGLANLEELGRAHQVLDRLVVKSVEISNFIKDPPEWRK